MLTFVIDTVSVFCRSFLLEDKNILFCDEKNVKNMHVEYIIDQISNVMNCAKKKFIDIDRICVNIGPGSFTGIRVGISVAKGLALALEKPIISINNFEAFAFEANKIYKKKYIKIIINAYGEFIYFQDFNKKNIAINSPHCTTITNLINTLDKKFILFGSGVNKIKNYLKKSINFKFKEKIDIETYMSFSNKDKFIKNPIPFYIQNKLYCRS